MFDVLLAEDDRLVRAHFAELLRGDGHRVRAVRDGEEALAACAERWPDLLVLDVMMPGLDGYTACREIRRRNPDLPILFLSALGDSNSRVAGLEAGADDYVDKMAADAEIRLRIAALLRRAGRLSAAAPFAFGGALVDAEACRLRRQDGTEVEMSPREVAILGLLAESEGRVVAWECLQDRFWAWDDAAGDATVKKAVQRLRDKLGTAAAALQTVYGQGVVYRAQRTGGTP